MATQYACVNGQVKRPEAQIDLLAYSSVHFQKIMFFSHVSVVRSPINPACSIAVPSTVARRCVGCRASPPGHGHPVVGIVIVDHGSRKQESNLMLEVGCMLTLQRCFPVLYGVGAPSPQEFARLYRTHTGRSIVEPAHMELAEPSISMAFDRCVEQGAQSVVVAPYFLSRGRHIQTDIPALVGQAAAKHPGVKYTIAEPIGLDLLMAQLIDNRHVLIWLHALSLGTGGPRHRRFAPAQGPRR